MTWKTLERFEAGRLVLLTSGAYSDFGVSAVVRVLVNFDPAAERRAWLAEHPDFEPYAFWADLEARGLVETVPHVEWQEDETEVSVWVEEPPQ